MNESLLLGVPVTVPSCGTMHETLGATNSPRGEQGAFQSPFTTSPRPHPLCSSQPSAFPSFPPFLLTPFTFRGSVSHWFLPPCQTPPAASLEPNIARDEEEWLLGVPAALPGVGGEGHKGAAVM